MIHFLALNYKSTSHTIAFLQSIPTGSRATILENSENSHFFELLRNHYKNNLVTDEPKNFSVRLENGTEINIIDSPKNIGFAAGINFLTNYLANDDLAVVINNDVTFSKSSAEALRTLDMIDVEEFWNNSIISPKIKTQSKIWYNGGRLSLLKLGGIHLQLDISDENAYSSCGFYLRRTQYVTGCCLIFKKVLIEKVGGRLFDEKFFFSAEDVELNIRCIQKEIERYVCPSVVLVTENSASSGGTKSEVGVSYESYYRTGLLMYVPKYMFLFSASFIIINRTVKASRELFRGNLRLTKSYVIPTVSALRDMSMGKYGRFRIK